MIKHPAGRRAGPDSSRSCGGGEQHRRRAAQHREDTRLTRRCWRGRRDHGPARGHRGDGAASSESPEGTWRSSRWVCDSPCAAPQAARASLSTRGLFRGILEARKPFNKVAAAALAPRFRAGKQWVKLRPGRSQTARVSDNFAGEHAVPVHERFAPLQKSAASVADSWFWRRHQRPSGMGGRWRGQFRGDEARGRAGARGHSDTLAMSHQHA